MTNKPGDALVDDYLRRAREGSHSYAVVPLEALKIACADLDAARERIDLYEWAVGRGVRVILKRDGSHSGMIRFSWFDQHDNAQHEYVRELWSGLRDLRERLQR